MIGEVLGGYRVTAKIGEGGMGVVYRAEHSIMGRQAVVKVLRPQLSSNRNMVMRFFNEARAAAAISHPGIVSVFDLGQREDGCAYIVMDFLQGESLGSRLRRRGRLESDEAIAITRQILSALSAAHEKGIVHRDLKPDNIFLVPDSELPGGERIKLLDFGIAKLQDDTGPGVLTTKAGALMGTPAYMSPEQCRGESNCDQRADLYAVGVMLFELLTGKPPFVARAPAELMAAHMRDVPPRLSDRVSGLPQGLEEIVSKLLAKAPEERYPSGTAALHRIDTLSGGIYASNVDSSRPPSHPIGLPTDPLAKTMMGGETEPPRTQGTTLSDSANSLEVAHDPRPKGSRRLWLGAAVAIAAVAALGTLLSVSIGEDSTEVVASSGGDAGSVLADADTEVIAPLPHALDASFGKTPASATPLANALPPLDFALVPPADNTQAKRHYSHGLGNLRNDEIEEAKQSFLKSMDSDPGHLYSRYQYGALLVAAGQVHEAVEILRQLKAKGCAQCLGRLQFARDDEAWKDVWQDPAFIKLTQGVRVRKPSVAKSAIAVANAITTDDYEATEALIAPRQVIMIWISPEGCKRNKCRERKRLQGEEAIASLVKDLEIQYGVALKIGEQKRCSQECCGFETTPDTALQVRKICTELDTAGVRSLSLIEFAVRDPSSELAE